MHLDKNFMLDAAVAKTLHRSGSTVSFFFFDLTLFFTPNNPNKSICQKRVSEVDWIVTILGYGRSYGKQ